jgi:hypothetical protein
MLLLPGAAFNGIDYVDAAKSQTQVYVHFLNDVVVAGSLTGNPPVTITGGEVITTVAVNPIDEATDWSADSQGHPILSLTVPAPGDFSTYTLTITGSDKLDPFFDTAQFSFKANCPSTLDCAAQAPACPQPPGIAVPIDYLAKDFGSFTQALSEFSTLRYPAWVERSEADVGVMLMEALSAMADELSYYQDRVAAESTLPTATQRLSVIRHARLVDYEPAPATAATTVLALDVAPSTTNVTINTPVLCQAVNADGTLIDFEIEDPAAGMAGAIGFIVDARWNRANLVPYYWDDSTACLLAGSTSLYLQDWNHGLLDGHQLLLDSPIGNGADPPACELVTIASVAEVTDQLVGQNVTRVFLTAPTTLDHDLTSDNTTVAGNIVPVVQGAHQTETFTIPQPTDPPGPVVVRTAANWTPEGPVSDYRYCLSQGPLVWLAVPAQDEDTQATAQPEMVLAAAGQAKAWTYVRWLLDAGASDHSYTLTPELYSPVLNSNGATWRDYDGDGGTTIRFGDGTFGISPQPGTQFTVTYRTGGGSAGNVPANTIRSVAAGQAQGPIIASCTNPFAATGGTDAETIAQVRVRAPQQFQAEPLRVVRPEDYVAAAQSQAWVQQAGTTFRWTGSWLTVLTAADPVGTEEPAIADLKSLTELLDARRLAGYESYVLPPQYVSIDLRITVCGQSDAFAHDVETAVLTRLQPGPLPDGSGTGFFDHSQWRFGQALEQSALFAAIQSCPGVVGVYQASFRQRGAQLGWAPLPQTLTFAADQILRVDNDPSRPDAGSLQVTVEGSK